MITIILSCISILLAVATLAVAMARSRAATPTIYGASLAISSAILVIAVAVLVAPPATVPAVTLPVGLPWLGAHFRVDALSAFFLAVVNLGAATASLFGLGYGRHEETPSRVLPFYPVFLAGMNLVVLADDAFTFLMSRELMSLSSWALVMAHHRVRDNTYAGYGGIFAGSYAIMGGVQSVVPVDLHMRGCPPRPVDLLKGMLALLERQER